MTGAVDARGPSRRRRDVHRGGRRTASARSSWSSSRPRRSCRSAHAAGPAGRPPLRDRRPPERPAGQHPSDPARPAASRSRPRSCVVGGRASSLLNEAAGWVPTPLTIAPGDLVALFAGGGRRRGDRRARRPASTCAPAGSSSARSCSRCWPSRSGIGIDVIANPFGRGVIRFVRAVLGRVHGLLDRRDDQQHQLDRRARRAVDRRRADRRGHARGHQPDDAGQPAAHRRPVLRAGRGAARVPALELPPGQRSSSARAASSSSATRWRCCRSSGSPRWRSRCWSSASRSSTRSGSSSVGCHSDARRSRPIGPTSTTGCSTSACRTATRCCSSTRSAPARRPGACSCRRSRRPTRSSACSSWRARPVRPDARRLRRPEELEAEAYEKQDETEGATEDRPRALTSADPGPRAVARAQHVRCGGCLQQHGPVLASAGDAHRPPVVIFIAIAALLVASTVAQRTGATPTARPVATVSRTPDDGDHVGPGIGRHRPVGRRLLTRDPGCGISTLTREERRIIDERAAAARAEVVREVLGRAADRDGAQADRRRRYTRAERDTCRPPDPLHRIGRAARQPGLAWPSCSGSS